MDVRCEKCGTEYEFDEDRIGPNGVTVKCTACGHVFKVLRKQKPGSAGDWLVKKADGQVIAFKQLTTLQKWIVEGRIIRDDEISRNGETWKRLGNIAELEPFFAVFDKAEALNELVAAGQVTGMERPLSIDGSSMLSPTNPEVADTFAPVASPAAAVVAGLSEITSPQEPSFAAPTIDAPKARGPSSPSRAPSGRSASPGETDEIVQDFAKVERKRRIVGLAGTIVAIGLVGGAALAWIELGKTPVTSTATDPRLEKAYAAFARDSVTSLDEARVLFEQAREANRTDAKVSGDLALVLTTKAAALRRAADDQDAKAQAAANELAAYEQAMAAREVSKKKKDLPPPPAKPTVPDPEKLRGVAAASRDEASKILKQALDIAKEAYNTTPEELAPRRALADYYRVQKDARVDTFLALAKKAAGEEPDAAIIYIEAAALYAKGPSNEPAFADAIDKLEKLTKLEPKMVRAKLLLARARLARGEKEKAKTALDAVLAATPEHEEAKRLAEILAPAKPVEAATPEPVAPEPEPTKPEPEPAEPEPVKPEPIKPEPIKPEPIKVDPKHDPAKHDPKKPPEDVPPARRCATYQDCMRAGDYYRGAGEPLDALLAYERAADRRPTAAQAFIGMAMSYWDQGKIDAALVQFKRAERINDGLPEVHAGKGACLEKLGQSADAITAYKRALELNAAGATLKSVQKGLERLGAE